MADPLPINREGGGQTQLIQDPNNPGSLMAAPFHLDIPNVFPSDIFSNPVTSAQKTDAEKALYDSRQAYLKSLTPTPEETTAQTQANDLETQLGQLAQTEKAGTLELQNLPASSRFASVQSRQFQQGISLQKSDIVGQLEAKYRQMGLLQQKRQGTLDYLKSAMGFAEKDLDRLQSIEQANQQHQMQILQYAQTLQDNQRQALATFAKTFEGNTNSYENMSPDTQAGVVNLAKQYGIDPRAAIAVINSQVDQNLLKRQKDQLEVDKLKKELSLPAKNDYQITEANGRRLLIDMQTAQIVKDLGAAQGTGGGQDLSSTIKDYLFAKAQGFSGDFLQYQKELYSSRASGRLEGLGQGPGSVTEGQIIGAKSGLPVKLTDTQSQFFSMGMRLRDTAQAVKETVNQLGTNAITGWVTEQGYLVPVVQNALDPAQQALMQKMYELNNMFVYFSTGKQINETEFDRLSKQTPNFRATATFNNSAIDNFTSMINDRMNNYLKINGWQVAGGASGGTTLMTGPDGSQWNVPSDKVDLFKQNGYK